MERRAITRAVAPAVIAAGAAVQALAGCGVAPSGPEATGSEGFPIVLTRTGGIAAFDDRLTITSDGSVTGRTRSGDVSCRLTAATTNELAAALRGATNAPPPPTSRSDLMSITVSFGGKVLDLGEATERTPAARQVSLLLGDITAPPAQRTLCR